MSSLSFLVDSPQDAKFRAEVSAWMKDNLPTELVNWSTRPPREMIQPWHFKLYERGWIAPHWPRKYGGMEASISEQLILQEELSRAGAPVLSRQALGHIGPILMQHGTDAQRKEHLPRMLSGAVSYTHLTLPTNREV